MALRLYGKPQTPIMPDDMVLASWATRAFGGGRSFQHAKSFTVALLPNSDRKVTVGAHQSGTPYSTASELNRVGEDGLLVVMDASEEIQFDMATTSPRWDILAIKITGAGTNTGTASLVVLKGAEGNTEGSTTVTLAGNAVNWTNTSTDRIWPLQNVQVTPGQAAVTLGGNYRTFAARAMQVLDKTPPDASALPAGTTFIDSTGSLVLRTTDANGTLTNRALSIPREVTYSIPQPSSIFPHQRWYAEFPAGQSNIIDINKGVGQIQYTLSDGRAAVCPATGATYALCSLYMPTTTIEGSPQGTGVALAQLDPAGQQWNVMHTFLPGAQHTHFCVSTDGTKIYSSMGYTVALRAIDITTGMNTAIALPPSAPTGLTNYQTVCQGDYLYIFGGLSSAAYQVYAAKYNLLTNTWTVLPNMPGIGGEGQAWATSGKVGVKQYCLNTVTDTWVTLNISGSTTLAPIGTLPNGKLYTFNTGTNATMHEIDPNTGVATNVGQVGGSGYSIYTQGVTGIDGKGRLFQTYYQGGGGKMSHFVCRIAAEPAVTLTAISPGMVAAISRGAAVQNVSRGPEIERFVTARAGDTIKIIGNYRMNGQSNTVTALVQGVA